MSDGREHRPAHLRAEAAVLEQQIHSWPTLAEQMCDIDAAVRTMTESGATAELYVDHATRRRLAALEEQLGGLGS